MVEVAEDLKAKPVRFLQFSYEWERKKREFFVCFRKSFQVLRCGRLWESQFLLKTTIRSYVQDTLLLIPIRCS